MKNDLLTSLKIYIQQNGKDALGNVGSTGSFVYAETDPQYIPECEALMICLTLGYHKRLNEVSQAERFTVKKEIVENLNNNEGLDLDICNRILDILEATLFEPEMPVEKNISEYGTFDLYETNKKLSVSLKERLINTSAEFNKEKQFTEELELIIENKDKQINNLIEKINRLKSKKVNQNMIPVPDDTLIKEKPDKILIATIVLGIIISMGIIGIVLTIYLLRIYL